MERLSVDDLAELARRTEEFDKSFPPHQILSVLNQNFDLQVSRPFEGVEKNKSELERRIELQKTFGEVLGEYLPYRKKPQYVVDPLHRKEMYNELKKLIGYIRKNNVYIQRIRETKSNDGTSYQGHFDLLHTNGEVKF